MSGSSIDCDDVFALYHEIGGKLDTLISGQTSLSTRMQAVEMEVSELNRTVRGHNGSPGLVTKVALIQEALKVSPHVDKPDDKPDGKQFITWQWLVDKAAMPVIVAFILWFLLTVLPQILGHIGLGGG